MHSILIYSKFVTGKMAMIYVRCNALLKNVCNIAVISPRVSSEVSHMAERYTRGYGSVEIQTIKETSLYIRAESLMERYGSHTASATRFV